MPIQKTIGYKASDGMVYGTVDEARRAELLMLFPEMEKPDEYVPAGIVNTILVNCDTVLSILTTGPRSRPRARKAAGTTAPKRAAAKAGKAATPAQAAEGFKGMREAVDAEAVSS